MNNNNGAEFEIQEILRIIVRRFYIFFIIVIPIIILVNYYYNSNIKPSYSTRIGLIVGNSINSGDAYDIRVVGEYQRFIDTYCALARTSIVAENAVKRLNNTVSPIVIQSIISPMAQASTQFMYINLTWSDPDEAIRMLTAVSDAFIEEAKKIYPTVNINVIESIRTPWVIMPSRKKYIAMGVAGGFVLSILIIFGLEFLDNKIRTEDDVDEHLNIPILTQIPNDKRNLGVITSKFMKNLNYGIIEAYRSLRTSIDFVAASQKVKAIIVTSSKPGEGKSTTAAMLSAVMAKSGKRTILIDCDLRRPNVHKIFNVPNTQGLSNFLAVDSRIKDVIHKSEIDNLYILPSGVIPSNPAELLSSPKMKGFVEILKEKFDCIIFDTPPVGLVTDAQVMCQYTDGCLFVIASGEATKEETIKAKKLIEGINGNILGVALNKVKKVAAYSKYNYYYSINRPKGIKRLFKASRNNADASKI